ncbi:MAG TPA: PIG-L deacetylase family protein [Limnochordia bacterium]|nr:PIG-L deacetylase family protein [Limnochordia bacterium]
MHALLLVAAVLAGIWALLWLLGRAAFVWLSRRVPPEQQASWLARGEALVGGPAHNGERAGFDASPATGGQTGLSGRPGIALAIAAHPDDVEYWLGGTCARLGSLGTAVDVVIATRGEKGGNAPNLAEIRTVEQARAAEILGYRRLIWLDLPDRGVADTEELRARLVAILDDVRPDLVFTFDAERPLPPYLHRDHQAIGFAAVAAFARWSGRAAARLVLFHTRRPNLLIDTSAVMAQKEAAFAAHASQHGAPRPLLRVAFWLLRVILPRRSRAVRGWEPFESFYSVTLPEDER